MPFLVQNYKKVCKPDASQEQVIDDFVRLKLLRKSIFSGIIKIKDILIDYELDPNSMSFTEDQINDLKQIKDHLHTLYVSVEYTGGAPVKTKVQDLHYDPKS